MVCIPANALEFNHFSSYSASSAPAHAVPNMQCILSEKQLGAEPSMTEADALSCSQDLDGLSG